MPGKLEVIFRQPLLAARVAKKSTTAVEGALARGAFRVERGAKHRAPTNYGILRGAILALREAGTLVWTVGSRGLRHAKFIEFGTGPAGRASPKVTALARQAMASTGYIHGPGGKVPPIEAVRLWATRRGIPDEFIFPIARAIGRGTSKRPAGIPAQPYLIPSYEEERPKIIADVAKAIRSSFGLK